MFIFLIIIGISVLAYLALILILSKYRRLNFLKTIDSEVYDKISNITMRYISLYKDRNKIYSYDISKDFVENVTKYFINNFIKYCEDESSDGSSIKYLNDYIDYNYKTITIGGIYYDGYESQIASDMISESEIFSDINHNMCICEYYWRKT